ncbi:MAG TPA: tRNA preQ1(34) S-adenosylmethionine ribosyltransferase-isomerase QueA [Candidatus Glassbacteria bacterium]|nr:tRNA preQ1(34) S-adenosylmethionine ribosyltransferase-isomerase QueA [Candidatus Glassbacteria bacterium]
MSPQAKGQYTTADFDYALPRELIASHPAERRDASRLLVVHRDTGRIEHRIFRDVLEYFAPGDVLALNNTRVFPARLTGNLPTGGAFEILLVRKTAEGLWSAMVKPGRKLKPGRIMDVAGGELVITVEGFSDVDGERLLRLEAAGRDVEGAIERVGHVPLPPYIDRPDVPADRERYQTVYASVKGAVAAPTAGLHFTRELIGEVREKGAEVVEITLHVGPGTFRPVSVEDIDKHRMDAEYYEIGAAGWAQIGQVRSTGGRLVAVGTTTTRALESAAEAGGQLTGWTELFIRPGHCFRLVDRLLTNFHLPRSTLLMLVSAFAGKELIETAYAEAVREKYRFYSYGDAMLIL